MNEEQRRRRTSTGFLYPVLDGSNTQQVYFDGRQLIPTSPPLKSARPPPPPTTPPDSDEHFDDEDGGYVDVHNQNNNLLLINLLQQQLTAKDAELMQLRSEAAHHKHTFDALEKLQLQYGKLKQKYKSMEANRESALAALDAKHNDKQDEFDAKISDMQRELAQQEANYAVQASVLAKQANDSAKLKHDLEVARDMIDRLKQNEQLLHEQLIAQRARAETLDKVVCDTQRPYEELLVKVTLPNGKRGNFVVNAFVDDPRKAAEVFALQYRLGVEATRVLVAFTLNECEAARF